MGLGNRVCRACTADLHYLSVQVHPGSAAAKKKEEKEAAPAPVPVPAAAPAAPAYDDKELVAVITAAIAASEGTSPSGFVVRSIRKINRKRR